jgi:hypothetical protein
MANERFSSLLISEGTASRGGVGSLSSAMIAGILLFIAGSVLVWGFCFLLAIA